MNKEHVDLFFEKGILRLNSFSKFRNYPDEIRSVKHEGGGAITGKSGKEGFQFHIMTQAGNDNYLLCSSILESNE